MAIKSITCTSGSGTKTYSVGETDERGRLITKIKGPKKGMYEVQCKMANGKMGGSLYVAAHNVTNVG